MSATDRGIERAHINGSKVMLWGSLIPNTLEKSFLSNYEIYDLLRS